MKTKFLAAACAASLLAGAANAVPVALTALTGQVGGAPAETSVFKADLSSLGAFSIAAIQINDSGSGIGGASGEFSGFDLDAIKVSATDCATAACAAGAVGLNIFDFTIAGTVFSGGAQRPPADPKLYGTNGAGTNVDNATATLGQFDADSSVVTPDGFISLGDGGFIAFNLTSIVNSAGLYLYIGEVGGNGETAAGNIEVFQNQVPAPATLGLLGLGAIALGALRRRDG
ncbi:PEP-CTERM sorting domain-containing protein [Pacificimonas sp. WHA3]|uniref:PEP-CTERM sorting domain-containing protein n=1 Tax=Pacificimonas pallii TaxID=2827236 RepID=A0ABS6SEN2_9SPHN|nr:PEP-CTERM sorting domain-containing protein [Pacificimonas pallii]MBV7256396.1 PEP-CTERM sorting domain-containing protein [Pacificimonas pallii]